MNRCWIQITPVILLLILDLIGILLLVLHPNEIQMPADNMFGIVLDAGSSHTSMYIYKWPADKQNGTGIVTQHEECDVEGPGISSYAGKEGGAAASLVACLEKAKSVIPKSRHHQTPICLGATAGMRLLDIENATESERVLKEVEKKLRSYPFLFKEATILSGQAEGAYGWVTVNYLLENFVKYGFVGRWINPSRDTIGALDLGGASTQITFQTSEKVEDKSNEMVLKLYGQTYTLYTQSFLCYGQDQFLRKLFAQLIQDQGLGKKIFHPCYPRGFTTSIVLGKDVFNSPCTKEYRPAQFDPEMTVMIEGTGNYSQCLKHVKTMFSFTNCSFSKCSFNGVFQPSVTGNYMAFSAFYFTQTYISQLTNISMTSPTQIEQAIQRVCNMTITELMNVTHRTEKFMKNVCAVANFVQILLIQGYHFDEHSLPSIAFRKKAGDASVGWALGYMLNVTNAVPAESLGVIKGMPSGAWSGVLAIFILMMLLSIIYLAITYVRTKH